MNSSVEDRLAALEAKVRLLEDHLALYQMVSAYGPAVDGLRLKEATELWAPDGLYEGDTRVMRGRDEIEQMLEGDVHQSLVAGGCAHVMSLPFIRVDGDRAVGIGYHRLYRHGDDGFSLFRLTASRWEWARTADGWKCIHRTHHLLNGSQAARNLLSRSVEEIRA